MTPAAPPGQAEGGAQKAPLLPPPPQLWLWAVAIYETPGVKDELLRLQDCFGVDVCVLLWAAWMHLHRCGVEPDTMDDALEAGGAIWFDFIKPAREARDRLKAPLDEAYAGVDRKEAAALRDEYLAVELNAEKMQLNTLERISRKGFVAARCADLRDALAECPALAHVPPTEFSPLIAAIEDR